MKITVLAIALTLMNSISLFSQEFEYAIKPSNDFGGFAKFSDGLAKTGQNWKYGFVDVNGNIAIKPIHDEAGDFHEGLAWVAKEDSLSYDKTYGYINTKGNFVVPYKYTEGKDFSSGRAAVKVYSGWQYINPKGEIAIDLVFDDPRPFKDGLLLVERNGKFGFIDTNGKTVIPFKYLYARSFSSSVAIVAESVKEDLSKDLPEDTELDKLYNSLESGNPEYEYKVIDTKGKTRFTLKEKNIDGLENFKNGASVFLKEGTAGFDNVYGIIDTDGTILLPAKYRQLFPFEGLVAFASVAGEADQNKDGYFQTIDIKGNLIKKIPLCFSEEHCIFDTSRKFTEGLMPIKISDTSKLWNGKWGYIDKNGVIVIKPQFENAYNFHEGLATVLLEPGIWAVIKNPLLGE